MRESSSRTDVVVSWMAACLCLSLIVGVSRSQSKPGAIQPDRSRVFSLAGVSRLPESDHDPLRHQKVALGKRLFFDRRLSENGVLSCASCHVPEKAFADNLPISLGVQGQAGNRNTPALINVAFQPYQFWDGRSSSLEDQALFPLTNPLEMGSSVERVLERLSGIPEYLDGFLNTFGSPMSPQSLAQALASYERTIPSSNSAYDRHMSGDQTAMTAEALAGSRLFHGKAHCHHCHQGQNLSDGLFHNLGVGWDGQRFADDGRFLITHIPSDKGAFKTPTLRQIGQTAPYMHDGSLPTLQAVVEFYDRGGNSNPHLDPLIQPRQLTAQEKEALVEFLKCLDGQVTSY
jgi:cytochrome c peroxidase